MVAGVSDFGQSQDIINRIGALRKQLFEANRQIATGKKTETFSGLGAQSQQLQSLRADASQIDRYIAGINTVEVRTSAMETGLAAITDLASELLDGLRLQVKEGSIELDALQNIARENLRFIQDILNTEINGRYIFAGTDSGNAPYASAVTLNNNIQSEISDWLDGTQTINQFLTDVHAFADTDLGYNGTISGAGDVFARIDKNLEINYTVKADGAGLQDIIRGLSVIANIQFPDPMVDIGTDSEFFQIITDVTRTLESGIADINNERLKLSNVVKTMLGRKEQHEKDEIILRGFADDIENVDMAEVIARLQQIEVQLQASFEATAMVNSLSLVNILS